MLPLRIAAGVGMAMTSGAIIDLDKMRGLRLSEAQRQRERLAHWRGIRTMMLICVAAGFAIYGAAIWAIF